jgi:hypothetical protein
MKQLKEQLFKKRFQQQQIDFIISTALFSAYRFDYRLFLK